MIPAWGRCCPLCGAPFKIRAVKVRRARGVIDRAYTTGHECDGSGTGLLVHEARANGRGVSALTFN